MRRRTVSPEIWTHEDLATADPLLTCVFIGLWQIADREGRLKDRPMAIKMKLMPARSIDMDQVLEQLEAFGLIHRYWVSGERFIQVTKFHQHQSPHPKEVASELPSLQDADPEGESMHGSSMVMHGSSMKTQERASHAETETGSSGSSGPSEAGSSGSTTPVHGSCTAAATASSSSSDLHPIRFLRHLVHTHGYDELRTRSKQGNIAQARQWDADGVQLCELDAAVVQSRRQLAAQGDDHDPPVSYLAKVIKGHRRAIEPVTSGRRTQPPPNSPGSLGDRLAAMVGQPPDDGQVVATQHAPHLGLVS